MKILIVDHPNQTWAAGKTLEEAIKNMKANPGRKERRWPNALINNDEISVIAADDSLHLDQMGDIQYGTGLQEHRAGIAPLNNTAATITMKHWAERDLYVAEVPFVKEEKDDAA